MDKEKKGLQMSPKQKDIYTSLKDIGEEISSFYIEGLKIIQGDSKIKPYLLAHVAREIDGGLRDVFGDKDKSKVFLSDEEIKDLKSDINNELEKKGISEVDNINGTVTSVCNFLHLGQDKDLVKEWVIVAAQFAKFAHRHGPHKNPRNEKTFLDVWERYENILTKIVGGYIELLDRVDQVLDSKKPSKEVLDTLPNLLKSETRLKYFFSHLDSEDWLDELHKLGYFDPENNPEPKEDQDNKGYYSIPHWAALDYLKKLTNQKISENTQKLINSIVHNIINYSDDKGGRIDNNITDGKIIEILSKLPLECIDDDFFVFLEKALNSRWGADFISADIEKYLVNALIVGGAKDQLIKLMNVVLKYEKSDVGFGKYSSIMAEFWLNELLNKHREDIVGLCGVELIEVLENKIKEIKAKDKDAFHHILVSSIGGRVDKRSTDGFINQLVYLLRDALISAPVDIVEAKIKEYLDGDDIFKRIAIYVIGVRFSEFPNTLFELSYNPIDNHVLKHELFGLFENNCSQFSEAYLKQIVKWIEDQEISIPDDKKDDKKTIELSIAYRKKEWLSSLLDSGSDTVKELYDKYNKINSAELDHPGLNFWSESGWVEEKSPLNVDQLLQLNNQEISKQLVEFKGKNHWEGPTKQGLADTLKAAIIENPRKFTENLDPFLNLDLIYINSMIRGFIEVWKKKKDFDWKSLLSFIDKIIKEDSFWSHIYDKGEYNYRNWVLSLISELIEAGTQQDENAFDIELLPNAIDILLTISDKSESDLEDINDDVVTSVLNSVKGKIYRAMVNCSLRNARVKVDKKDKKKWIEDIKSHFDYILKTDSEKTIEFFTVLGEYLKYIYYLDNEWVIENLDKIFPKDDDRYWEAAFTGYLYYSLSKDLSNLIIKHGDYDKAIKYDLKGEYPNKYLVQHICAFYIHDEIKLSDKNSLIVKLLDNKKKEHISELIWYFWAQRKTLSPELKAKVKPTWEYLVNLLKDDDTVDSREHISNLTEWLSLVDEIDNEILEWLKIAASSFDKEYRAATFVEYLNRHADKTPENVGEVFKELLDSGTFPLFREEDVIGIVEKLYENGLKEASDYICNKYAENGIYFLRDIYNSNQNK